jgi:tRNA (pseudouridine54-N1)-methyltransferase
MVVNALFVSQSHRPDTRLCLVCESSADYPRTLILDGESIGDVEGINEAAVLALLAEGLRAGRHLGKDDHVVCDSGVVVQASGFEKILSQQTDSGVFLLQPKGEDIRSAAVDDSATFIMTDHIPMPAKIGKSLIRRGARPLSLGPAMLHASQCITVIHNELDRRRRLY